MQNTFDKQRVLAVIEERITPFIGHKMAEASTRVHCQKLGIVEAKVSPEKVEALVDKIGKAMLVFVGKEKADQIVKEIRQSIGMGG